MTSQQTNNSSIWPWLWETEHAREDHFSKLPLCWWFSPRWFTFMTSCRFLMDSQSQCNGHGLAGNIKVVWRWLPVGWSFHGNNQPCKIAVGRVGFPKRQRPATCNLTTAMCNDFDIDTSHEEVSSSWWWTPWRPRLMEIVNTIPIKIQEYKLGSRKFSQRKSINILVTSLSHKIPPGSQLWC